MRTTAEAPVLSLHNLEVAFPVGKKLFEPARYLYAVNGVSADLQRGEFLSIVGESGCGKSTLAKTLLGLQAVSGGEVKVEGRELATFGRKDLSRLVQPIFQDPYSSLNPRKTVAANIALPLRLQGTLSRAELKARVRDTMKMVGLPERFEHSYPSQMSGGQRQRVAIARALITRPSVLICDEPTSALDVSVQAQILNLLQDLSTELNLTVLFISHDLSVVRHLSHRVAVMYLGRIVEIGESEQVFERPRHPYTQLLVNSILPPDPSHRLPESDGDTIGPDPTNIPSGCAFRPRCPYATGACATEVPALVDADGTEVACLAYAPAPAGSADDHDWPELTF